MTRTEFYNITVKELRGVFIIVIMIMSGATLFLINKYPYNKGATQNNTETKQELQPVVAPFQIWVAYDTTDPFNTFVDTIRIVDTLRGYALYSRCFGGDCYRDSRSIDGILRNYILYKEGYDKVENTQRGLETQ